MASSSSSRKWKYDVFFSFRGEDTRQNFLSHLDKCLTENGIITFKDDTGLRRGEEIGPALSKAIETSMIALIIFSKDYATSPWCLDELLKIMECKKECGQTVMPIFYHVDPEDVENPRTGIFAEAFGEHDKNFKVKEKSWRVAMTQVANLSGHHLKNFRSESELVETIKADILQILQQISSVYTHKFVGLDSPIAELKSLLSNDDTGIVGIVGMGGIGKTTMARVIYRQISDEFEGKCFIENVAEKSSNSSGLFGLAEQLVSGLLNENVKIDTPFVSDSIHANRLRHRKVLVVLDDVNHSKQLKALIDEDGTSVFGQGSRIIITSRDKQLLRNFSSDNGVYEVRGLLEEDARQLFCRHAFKKKYPDEDFRHMLGSILRYAGGNPLALEILGSSLFKKGQREWQSTLNKLKRGPLQGIQKILRISYDGLDEEEQRIFLHVVCILKQLTIFLHVVGFLKELTKNGLIRILAACDLSAEHSLNVLMDKCLLEIHLDCHGEECVGMHDLLREMGMKIVREESTNSGRQILLWDPDDIRRVLTTTCGTEATEVILLDIPYHIDLDPNAFRRMTNLKILTFDSYNKVHVHNELEYLPNELRILHWDNYPLKHLPAHFQPRSLVELILRNSTIEQLWEGIQDLRNLRKLDLCGCEALIKLPDMSLAQNLECLDLSHCSKLIKISKLSSANLQYINLSWCSELIEIPELSLAANIEKIFLRDCYSLVEIPLCMSRLNKLQLLDLMGCYNIMSLPSTVAWKSIKTLELKMMYKLEKFPEIGCLNGLKTLKIVRCVSLISLPSSMWSLESLEEIHLIGCSNLFEITEYPLSCYHPGVLLKKVHIENCPLLQKLSGIEKLLKFKQHSEDEEFTIIGCLKVDEFIWRRIVAVAEHGIKAMAIRYYFQDKFYRFMMIYPGREIPEWIKHRRTTESISIKLPANDTILGFAMSAVIKVGIQSEHYVDYFKCNIKFRDIRSGNSYDVGTITRELDRMKRYFSSDELDLDALLVPDKPHRGWDPYIRIDLSEHVFLIHIPFKDCDREIVKLRSFAEYCEATFEVSAGDYPVIMCGVVALLHKD